LPNNEIFGTQMDIGYIGHSLEILVFLMNAGTFVHQLRKIETFPKRILSFLLLKKTPYTIGLKPKQQTV
jgi:hypothetical protein